MLDFKSYSCKSLSKEVHIDGVKSALKGFASIRPVVVLEPDSFKTKFDKYSNDCQLKAAQKSHYLHCRMEAFHFVLNLR